MMKSDYSLDDCIEKAISLARSASTKNAEAGQIWALLAIAEAIRELKHPGLMTERELDKL